jgi:hypothetical protein
LKVILFICQHRGRFYRLISGFVRQVALKRIIGYDVVMNLKPKGRKFVNDSPSDKFGVYVWRMPNGSYIMDEDRNFLSIAGTVNDPIRVHKLREAARSFGITEGEPVFFAGHRKIDDEEYEIQRERARLGLVPDTEDVGSLIDDLRAKNARH